VNEALAKLPAPPSENQVVIVDRLLTSFETKMRRRLSGARGENDFKRELRNLIDRFDQSLKRTRPQLLVIPSAKEEEMELKMWKSGQGDQLRRQGMSFDDSRREETPTPCNAITAPSPLTGDSELRATPRKRPSTAVTTPGRNPQRVKPQRGW
jgi:hypothetical protein